MAVMGLEQQPGLVGTVKMGVPGGECLESWAGYPGGSRRARRSG